MLIQYIKRNIEITKYLSIHCFENIQIFLTLYLQYFLRSQLSMNIINAANNSFDINLITLVIYAI